MVLSYRALVCVRIYIGIYIYNALNHIALAPTCLGGSQPTRPSARVYVYGHQSPRRTPTYTHVVLLVWIAAIAFACRRFRFVSTRKHDPRYTHCLCNHTSRLDARIVTVFPTHHAITPTCLSAWFSFSTPYRVLLWLSTTTP